MGLHAIKRRVITAPSSLLKNTVLCCWGIGGTMTLKAFEPSIYPENGKVMPHLIEDSRAFVISGLTVLRTQ